MYSISWSPEPRKLPACPSADADTDLNASTNRNRHSTFSPLTPFLPLPKYFESEWSYAQYRIPVQSSHISLSSTSRSAAVDMPEEERCVVGWIEAPAEDPPAPSNTKEFQLIALTYTGGWYRLSLPKLTGRASKRASGSFKASPLSSGSPPQPSHVSRAASIAGSTASRLDKGKERERDKEKDKKESRNCTLQEYRRFGRWDGWG